MLKSNVVSEPLPDRDLIHAARTGDRAAFGELYRRYARMVHGLLVARVGPDLAEDLLQDVFLRGMTQLSRLREDDHFGGWIAAIARNRAIDHYRRARELQSTEDVFGAIATADAPSTHSEAHMVLEAIRSMPDAYRDTLSLRLVEGMTGPEIALQTGLAPESVRVNLHRGMKLLRGRLQRGGKERKP